MVVVHAAAGAVHEDVGLVAAEDVERHPGHLELATGVLHRAGADADHRELLEGGLAAVAVGAQLRGGHETALAADGDVADASVVLAPGH